MPVALRLTACPTPRRGSFQVSGDTWLAVDIVSCRRWKCVFCGPKKAYKLRERIKLAKYERFMTLTHKPRPGQTQEAALRELRHNWHTLHKAIDRLKQGTKIQYVAIVEWTKAGQPHLHILFAGPYIQQRKLSGMWRHINNSPIVDIRAVKEHEKTAHYLAKYLTKDNACPPRMRRWSCSRGFLPDLPPYENPNWPDDSTITYTATPPMALIRHLITRGYTVIEGPGSSVILYPMATADTRSVATATDAARPPPS